MGHFHGIQGYGWHLESLIRGFCRHAGAAGKKSQGNQDQNGFAAYRVVVSHESPFVV
jgi:hypothetical protein